MKEFKIKKYVLQIIATKVLCFSTMYISSITGGAQGKEFLKTTSNILMRMIFTMVDIINVRVREIRFSTL